MAWQWVWVASGPEGMAHTPNAPDFDGCRRRRARLPGGKSQQAKRMGKKDQYLICLRLK